MFYAQRVTSRLVWQAVMWCKRHLGAGAGFGLVPYCDHRGEEAMRLACSSHAAYPPGRLYRRGEHPLLFSAHDSGGVEVYEGVPYAAVGAPGPGRHGGGTTEAGLLLVAVRDRAEACVATLGVDLFMSEPARRGGGVKAAFTEENIEAAAEAGALAGEVIEALMGHGDSYTVDWDTAFYARHLERVQKKLLEREASAMARLKRPSIPLTLTLTLTLIGG